MAITYTTWNGSDKTADITLSGGNLIGTDTSDGWGGVRSIIGKSSGKWYWEVVVTTDVTGGAFFVGVATSDAVFTGPAFFTGAGTTVGMLDNGNKRGNPGGTDTNVTTAYGNGTILGIALDMDAGTLSMYKNNVQISGGTIFTGLSDTFYAIWNTFYLGNVATANFGATALVYTPPSGFNAGLYSGSNDTAHNLTLLGVGT